MTPEPLSLMAFLPSTDLGRSQGFYEGVLGLRVVETNQYALVLNSCSTMLRVALVETLTPQPFTILGWQVAGIRAEIEALSGRGVEFLRYDGMDQDDLGIWTTPNGDQIAWFKDPDGNTLSLTEFT